MAYVSQPENNSKPEFQGDLATKIEEAIEKFLLQLGADGRPPHTIGQYRRHTRLFASWLRDVGYKGDLDEINHEVVAQFLTAPVAHRNAHGGEKRARGDV